MQFWSRKSLLLASALGGLALVAGPPSARRRPASARSTNQIRRTSKQDTNLKPHATPPTVTPADKLPLDKIKLPAGFKAEVWSSGHPGARTMVEGPKGTIFMGTRQLGRVYAITNKDGKREVKTLLQGLTQPNGLAFKDGALYVLAINKVFRYDNIEDKLDNPGDRRRADRQVQPAADTIHHNWKYADVRAGRQALHPGRRELQHLRDQSTASTARSAATTPDGSGMEIVARGVRNTVGFDWHPVTKELWFTDNGRDWAGNAGPEDELNVIAKGKEGAFYGFPYCHANGIPDPDIKIPNPCAGVTLPAALTGPHSAGLGIKFYTGNMFPKSYQNVAFIARRGSWNREQKFGYDVVVARTSGGKAKIEPFLTGLLDEKANDVPRPADLRPSR